MAGVALKLSSLTHCGRDGGRGRSGRGGHGEDVWWQERWWWSLLPLVTRPLLYSLVVNKLRLILREKKTHSPGVVGVVGPSLVVVK